LYALCSVGFSDWRRENGGAGRTIHAIGVGFAMSGKLAAVFSQEFYAQEPTLGNKHTKRVIDLLVSLDASHNIDKIGRCD
jgi:hypothetical protein